MPQVFGPPGVSNRTPQRCFWPAALSGKVTVAVKAGHPSSAVTAVIGDSVQLLQVPAMRAFWNSGRLRPVRKVKRTVIMPAPPTGGPGEERVPRSWFVRHDYTFPRQGCPTKKRT